MHDADANRHIQMAANALIAARELELLMVHGNTLNSRQYDAEIESQVSQLRTFAREHIETVIPIQVIIVEE